MDPITRKEINLDSVLNELGHYGNYNKLNFILLMFPILLSGIYECGYIFEAPPIEFRCQIPECEGSGEYDTFKNFTVYSNDTCFRYAPEGNASSLLCNPHSFNASQVIPCDNFIYESEHSIVKEFNLGCQDWKRTLIGTVHNSGMFLALLLTGAISDRYGRTVALGLSCMANFIFGVSRSFTQSYESYTVLHFMESGFGGGLYTSCFVLAVELVAPKQRVVVTPLFNITFVFGLVILASLAWLLDNWRILLLSVYSPALIVAIYAWTMKESARWLLSKGRREDAIRVLECAAKMNKKSPRELELSNISSPLISNDSKDNTSELAKVFKSSFILMRLASCSFLWVSCTFVYYGMSINSVALAGNKFVNYILAVVVEIPANLLVIAVLDKYGRKKTIIATFVISGIMCIAFSFLPPETGWWGLSLYLLGKSSVTLTYSSVYVYVSEVFPTSMRQTLISICSTFGRLGSLTAPLTPLLAKYYHSLPSLTFGAMCVAASVVMICSPETNHTRLPDTIEEAEQLARRHRDGDG